jgi:uncharacterized membrane protein
MVYTTKRVWKKRMRKIMFLVWIVSAFMLLLQSYKRSLGLCKNEAE